MNRAERARENFLQNVGQLGVVTDDVGDDALDPADVTLKQRRLRPGVVRAQSLDQRDVVPGKTERQHHTFGPVGGARRGHRILQGIGSVSPRWRRSRLTFLAPKIPDFPNYYHQVSYQAGAANPQPQSQNLPWRPSVSMSERNNGEAGRRGGFLVR